MAASSTGHRYLRGRQSDLQSGFVEPLFFLLKHICIRAGPPVSQSCRFFCSVTGQWADIGKFKIGLGQGRKTVEGAACSADTLPCLHCWTERQPSQKLIRSRSGFLQLPFLSRQKNFLKICRQWLEENLKPFMIVFTSFEPKKRLCRPLWRPGGYRGEIFSQRACVFHATAL